MIPKGLLIAVSVGVLSGAILGVFLIISESNQVKFVEGASLSIVTEKTDYQIGEPIEIHIVNSGTIPLTFSDSSYGVKITALDGTLIYFPESEKNQMILQPHEEKNLVWNQMKNDGEQSLQGTYKISAESLAQNKQVKKSTTINIFK